MANTIPKPSRVRFPVAGIAAHSVQVIQENERPLAAIALQAGVKIGPPRLKFVNGVGNAYHRSFKPN
jgi:hypothetical protein